MDGFMWGEWPAGKQYYGKGIPVPTPIPGLVHQHKAAKKTTRAAPDGQRLLSPHGFADDEDGAAPDIEEQNEIRAAKASTTGPPNPKNRPDWVRYTLSYMDQTIIPNYWEYALKFTLCDNFFSSLKGNSLPNHLYLVAAQSGGIVSNPAGYTYTYSFPSIIELLGQGGVTWKYYSGFRNQAAHPIWDPLPGFEQYANDPHLNGHLAQTAEFYEDLKNNSLPQVCWLTPTYDLSEHPPQDVRQGIQYVTDLVNAVMKSSYWQNCAIIVTWDDSGGFYDHVPPIQTDEYGFGFRVPTIVISPYSMSGAIIHTQYDLTSLLKLVEAKFGLPSLTARDGASNAMLECFNFNQQPLPPVIINKDTKLDFQQSAYEHALKRNGVMEKS
jgi:phospholipase C